MYASPSQEREGASPPTPEDPMTHASQNCAAPKPQMWGTAGKVGTSRPSHTSMSNASMRPRSPLQIDQHNNNNNTSGETRCFPRGQRSETGQLAKTSVRHHVGEARKKKGGGEGGGHETRGIRFQPTWRSQGKGKLPTTERNPPSDHGGPRVLETPRIIVHRPPGSSHHARPPRPGFPRLPASISVAGRLGSIHLLRIPRPRRLGPRYRRVTQDAHIVHPPSP